MPGEKCLEGYILDDAKCPCQLLARTMHQSYLLIFKENFRSKTFVSTRIDLVMVFGYFIGDTYCKTSGVHEYEYRVDTYLRTLRKG